MEVDYISLTNEIFIIGPWIQEALPRLDLFSMHAPVPHCKLAEGSTSSMLRQTRCRHIDDSKHDMATPDESVSLVTHVRNKES